MESCEKLVLDQILEEKRQIDIEGLVGTIFSETERHQGAMVDRICRRVFDVLNVFEAIEMISRDGKMIKWMENQEKQEETQLKNEKEKLEESIRQKMEQLTALRTQLESYKSLHIKDKNVKNKQQKYIFGLPFVVVRTSKNTKVGCRSTSCDK